MPSDERLAAGVYRFAGVAACVSVVVGVAVFTGWVLDVRFLKNVAPGLVSMKANTAIGFVLAGGSLWLLRDESASRDRRVAGAWLGGAIAAFAVLTLAEYVFGVDLRIDHLFNDPGVSTSSAGRPSPHTTIAFLAVGLWLTALSRRGDRADRIRNWLSAIACLVVLQAAIGYLFGVKYLYGISGVTGMALHTMATFVILCLGILAARPKRGFVGLLTSGGTGGAVVLRLAPAVILLPLLTGYARLKAQQLGLFGLRDGIALLVGSTVVLLGGLVIYTGLSLNRADSERHQRESTIREQQDAIRQQQEAIRELSTPVLQVRDGLLILPIIGVIDTQRARQLTEQLLHSLRLSRAKVVVLDITGVATVDTEVANHLVQTIEAARLMGATAIVSGLSAEVAQTLVSLGVDVTKLNTIGDLQSGIEQAERMLGDRAVAPQGLMSPRPATAAS